MLLEASNTNRMRVVGSGDLSIVIGLCAEAPAVRMMRSRDFDQIPVVDKDDKLHSMLFDMDLMRALF